MYWKEDYVQGKYNSSEFLQRKVEKYLRAGVKFPSKSGPRGAKASKIDNIIHLLCPHMELIKWIFWSEIPRNENSPD